MKIIRTKKESSSHKADMFVVMCLIQSVSVILCVLCLYVVSKTDGDGFLQTLAFIDRIFSDDLDPGGYFTHREDGGVQPVPGMSEASSENNNSVISLSQNNISSASENKENGEENETAVENEDRFSCALIPVSGVVTSGYGEREHPIYSGISFHKGEDIAADEGSPIYAVLDGVVVDAGSAQQAGNYVKIDHGNNIETLYCHCCELYVSEGMRVSCGDVIASVGQTGLATGPHLHFELHENGVAIDPEKLLSVAKSVS